MTCGEEELVNSAFDENSIAAIEPGLFRQVLGRFGTGVTIVTTQVGSGIVGMTASAFMSGSLRPPLVVVSVGSHTKLHGHLLCSDVMGISILGVEHEPHSRHFSGQRCQPVTPRFACIDGIPVVADALATIATRVTGRHSCGDHTLFIGLVQHMACREGAPLMFFKGAYRELSESSRDSMRIGAHEDLAWEQSWW